jgi:hypothetical protein
MLSAEVQCGEFLPKTDIPGENLPNSGEPSSSKRACRRLCRRTPTCNAVVRDSGPEGLCFLKNVDASSVVPVAGPYESYLFCTDDTAPPVAAQATGTLDFLLMLSHAISDQGYI